jgi:hypothetical protein
VSARLPDSCSALDHEETMLRFRKEALLRARGWKHSSSHAGAFWMFSKRIGRRTYHLPFDMAWALESNSKAEYRAVRAEIRAEDEARRG